MKVRRKSLWRSQNNKHARKRANQRAAKERIRLERLARDEPMPDVSGTFVPKRLAPLFVVSIRCRDGERVTLPVHEIPGGLSVSPTAAGRKVAAVLKHYRPVGMTMGI